MRVAKLVPSCDACSKYGRCLTEGTGGSGLALFPGCGGRGRTVAICGVPSAEAAGAAVWRPVAPQPAATTAIKTSTVMERGFIAGELRRIAGSVNDSRAP